MKMTILAAIFASAGLFVLPGTGLAAVNSDPVYVSFPLQGSEVSGKVTLIAAAQESARIVAVQFQVDGNNVGSETGQIPFSLIYDFSTLPNGTHTIGAKARDLSGYYINASLITVTVNNPTPFTVDTIGTTVAGASSATISWTTSRPATFQLDYGTTYGYGNTVTSGYRNSSHRVTLARLGSETKYFVRVRAWDQDYNLATRTDFSFITASRTGAEAIPQATLYSSQSGNAVNGVVTLTVMPGFSDHDGAQFQVDGWDIGSKLTGQNLQIAFDTTILNNGPHAFSAIIWDKRGNTGHSNTISFGVANAATPAGTAWVDSSNARLINASGTFFLVSAGRRYGITDPGVLKSYGFEFKDAVLASATDLALPQGSVTAPGDGSLVKKSGDSTVWFITGGKKHGFTSAEVFLGLGFSWQNVREVAGPVLDALGQASPLGSASSRHLSGVFVNASGTIYRMEDNLRRGIPSLEVFNSWNIDNDFSAVAPANAADLAVPVGTNLDVRRFQQ